MKNKRSTFSILFYPNTSKMKKLGKCPVMGRLSVDGESAAFSTGMDIFPSSWDSGTGTVIGKSGETREINKRIDAYKTEAALHYRDMVENHGYVTAELLKNALRGIGTRPVTVMQEFSVFPGNYLRTIFFVCVLRKGLKKGKLANLTYHKPCTLIFFDTARRLFKRLKIMQKSLLKP